ncbi:UDP-glucose--hexose-1-phosphate uridylyltransferase [Bacillus pinisoli]|uniref:UDP-glucose--hexose-1-phosphate uridylyltransferase n=1 Tax=Bacillus pinisoli TaxID=2901866 RepID=UPI001FF4E3DD|nr:UDP-glucose--hexose-1-phosphate uridylyltransferase [Bacillus pinisoli]
MKEQPYYALNELIKYGLEQKLLQKEDRIYVQNRLLATLGLDEWKEAGIVEVKSYSSPHLILEKIVDWAYEAGVIEHNTTTERDLLDATLMNCLLPRPSELIREFSNLYTKHPKKATDRYYQVSTASNYIRMDRIEKNLKWQTETEYGKIDITINLSKPEKDPKEIAKLKELPQTNYPTCLLCAENEGYQGTLRHPARANHRIIPITLHEEDWFLQYSPYVYYNEHSIVFRAEHLPMKISRDTFSRLLDFVEKFPHYFVGSNADLPIVGGSILSHDHFQGGHYTFPIERAATLRTYTLSQFPSCEVHLVHWPMSVLRVRGNKEDVLNATTYIWSKWLSYNDEAAEVLANTNDTPHNTITPIARRSGERYEMDIVLRNNRTNEEHPDGIFHPHQELHHIKKENIGLIEVMGLAVLPGRLKEELKQIESYLEKPVEQNEWPEHLIKHWDWYQDLKQAYSNNTCSPTAFLQEEVGKRFSTVLEHAGVFKQDDQGIKAFERFITYLQELSE